MDIEPPLPARQALLYRVEITVSPLLPREMPLVIEAFTNRWGRPEEIEKGHTRDAGALMLSAEGHLRPGEKPAELVRQITFAIWQNLGRYVKVTAEATYIGDPPQSSFEFGEEAYTRAYETRFEN